MESGCWKTCFDLITPWIPSLLCGRRTQDQGPWFSLLILHQFWPAPYSRSRTLSGTLAEHHECSRDNGRANQGPRWPCLISASGRFSKSRRKCQDQESWQDQGAWISLLFQGLWSHFRILKFSPCDLGLWSWADKPTVLHLKKRYDNVQC